MESVDRRRDGRNLVEQYQLPVRIRDHTDRPNRAVIEIRAVKAEPNERREGVEGGRLPEEAERLQVALGEARAVGVRYCSVISRRCLLRSASSSNFPVATA